MPVEPLEGHKATMGLPHVLVMAIPAGTINEHVTCHVTDSPETAQFRRGELLEVGGQQSTE